MENRKFPVKICNKNFCDLNSSENFNEEVILEFNKRYWELNLWQQKNFILNTCKRFKLQNNTYKFEYFLKFKKVSSKFFIRVFDYNDYHIIKSLSNSIDTIGKDWNNLIIAHMI